MELIVELLNAWVWVGIDPIEIVRDNEFGNLIIRDKADRYWRLCPEELSCEVVANNWMEFEELLQSKRFLHDWRMIDLVSRAMEQLGALLPGYRYCLKVPAVLGGEYGGSNLSSMPLKELVAVSGHFAKEIEGLPDGAQVRLVLVD